MASSPAYLDSNSDFMQSHTRRGLIALKRSNCYFFLCNGAAKYQL
jgi:hypothetical protein